MSHLKKIAIQEENDLKNIIELITRNYRFIIISLAVTLSLAFIFNQFSTPVYKISSSILIREGNQSNSRNVNDYLNSSLFGMNKNFKNELWVLKSSPVIEQTINNLDLIIKYYIHKGIFYQDAYKNVPFQVLLLKNHVQPVNIRFDISIQDSINFHLRAKSKDVLFYNFNTNEISHQKDKWLYNNYGKFGQLIENEDFAFIIILNDTNKILSQDGFIYSF